MVCLVAFGGGTDSTAMLVEMVRRGEPRPHAILFADTGGEHPHTYAHIETFSAWLVLKGYPAITSVHRATIAKIEGKSLSLEQDCLARKTVPSVAFGFKTCSQKFKVQPQEKWANNDVECNLAWAAGLTVTRLVGFEYGEERRAREADAKYTNRYPLIEWKMDRDACKEAILIAGLRLPGKSSCFFCPNSKKYEIKALADTYPALLDRALAMEANAELTQIKGLGRNFAWADFIAGRDASPELPMEMPCECYDGAAE